MHAQFFTAARKLLLRRRPISSTNKSVRADNAAELFPDYGSWLENRGGLNMRSAVAAAGWLGIG
jgi:hypothetical protein